MSTHTTIEPTWPVPSGRPTRHCPGRKPTGTIAAINGERAVDESFGALLRRHRLAASLTQEALAERAAVSATAIAALERGRRRAPRLSTLRLIARALDLSAGDLAELSRAASAEVDAGVSPPDNRSETSEQPSPDDPVPPPTRSGGEGGLPLPKVIVRRWRTGFVGRGKELAELDRAWEDRRPARPRGRGRRHRQDPTRHRVRRTPCSRWRHRRLGPMQRGGPGRLPALRRGRPTTRGHRGSAPDWPRPSAHAGELTRLVPEIATSLGPLPSPTRAESGTEQRLLFEAVSSLLAGFAPMLVVLDDLHWADEATIATAAIPRPRPGAERRRHRRHGPRRSTSTPTSPARLAELGRQADTARVRLGAFDDEVLDRSSSTSWAPRWRASW